MSYKVTMEDDYSSDSEHSDSGHDELSNLLGDHSVSEQEMSGMVRSQSFVDETQRMMRGMNLRGMMMVVKSLFEIRNRSMYTDTLRRESSVGLPFSLSRSLSPPHKCQGFHGGETDGSSSD